MTHLKHVGAWLNDLATMTAGSMPIAEAKARVASLASMLAEDFPAEAFNRASLRAVAGENTFFPTYKEIRDGIAACLPKRLPSAGELPPGTQAAITAWSNCGLDDRLPRLRVLRRYQPEAYARLIEQHDGARKIAMAQGWLTETQRESPRVAVPA